MCPKTQESGCCCEVAAPQHKQYTIHSHRMTADGRAGCCSHQLTYHARTARGAWRRTGCSGGPLTCRSSRWGSARSRRTHMSPAQRSPDVSATCTPTAAALQSQPSYCSHHHMMVRIPEPPRRTLPVNASQSPVLFGLADDSADRLVCGVHDR